MLHGSSELTGFCDHGNKHSCSIQEGNIESFLKNAAGGIQLAQLTHRCYAILRSKYENINRLTESYKMIYNFQE
jgi:hypothetical protein